MDESVEGYTNRETYDLCLWLSNERGLYDLPREIARGAPDVSEAAENLRTWVVDVLWDEAMETDHGRAMVRDVGSLWRVNWSEIVQTFRSD